MKKISLAIALILSSLIAGAQTFTVTNEGLLPQSWWPIVVNEQDAVINCPQAGFMDKLESKGAFRNSGTFIEGLAQANLGNIKNIIFAPGVSTVDLSSRTQQVTKLCADGVKITADHPVTIIGTASTGQAVLTITGKNDTISNLTFSNAFFELVGTSSYISNNVFNMSTAWGCVYLYNTSKNTVINNICNSTSTSGNLSAIRIGANPAGLVFGNTKNDKILYNTVDGFSGNGLQAGEWKSLTPQCDSLLIRGNIFKNNANAGAYVINSTGTIIDSNYIYGNNGGGLFVEDSKYCQIYSNSVGVDQLGNVVGNKGNGININGGNNIRVGDFVKGPNVVVGSGNNVFEKGSNNGIAFQLGATSPLLPKNSSVKANFVGIKADGSGSIATGTQQCGIYFDEMASNATILNDTVGGMNDTDGNTVGFSGLIGGSGSAGIQLNQNNNTVVIYNNYVGIGRNIASIPNRDDGIALRGAKNCDVWANKAGNNIKGIAFRNSRLGTVQTTFSKVRGNFVGTSDGIDSHPNILDMATADNCGISLEYGTNNSTVGGANMADSNIVLNEEIGIWVAGTPVSNLNTIKNNRISKCSVYGVLVANATTLLSIENNAITNSQTGIAFTGAAVNATVKDNTIDNHNKNGISIAAAITNATFTNNTITNTVDGNGIIVSAAAENMAIRNNTITGNKYLGAGLQPSKGNGIYMTAGKTSIIGGTGINEGNTITDNQTDGISLNGMATTNIMMRRNIIACNAGTGINLNASANTNYMLDIIRVDTNASTVNSITGILKGQTTKDVIIEVFGPSIACRQTCNSAFGRQGYSYLGTTTTDAAGIWTLTLAAPIALGDVAQITATATTPTALNIAGPFVTSEFSRCNDILPVEFLSFTAVKNQNGVLLSWKTATETNNDYFLVERSIDGIHFTAIGAPVKGAGTSQQVNAYKLLDINPSDGINYYRIRQVDYDGKFDFSDVKVVNLAGVAMVTVSPNPSNGHFSVKIISESSSLFVVDIFNALGQIIYTKTLSLTGGYAEQKVSLDHVAAGVYTLVVKNDSDHWVNKVIKE